RAKSRTNKFYDLEVDNYNEKLIEIAIMSVLTNVNLANFEEVVRRVITSGELKDNDYLNEFQKYNIEEAFCKHVSHTFAYVDEHPTLEKFVISLYLTYTQTIMDAALPDSMSDYILSKSGTVIAFMDQTMNNRQYQKDFDRLSEQVFKAINGEAIFNAYPIDDFIDRKSTRLNSSHVSISYAVFCLKNNIHSMSCL